MGKRSGRSQDLKKKFIHTFERNFGNITRACRAVDVTRKTFYNWYNSDKAFKEAVDDMEQVNLDFVECALYSQVKRGNTAAIIFFLKCKGKARGYIEKSEVEGGLSKETVTIIRKVLQEKE